MVALYIHILLAKALLSRDIKETEQQWGFLTSIYTFPIFMWNYFIHCVAVQQMCQMPLRTITNSTHIGHIVPLLCGWFPSCMLTWITHFISYIIHLYIFILLKCHFISTPYKECKKSRHSRNCMVPDPSGLFDGHVWPMYLKHRNISFFNWTDQLSKQPLS